MARLSNYLLPTEKQAPADAEAVSHKLMVRAGLVRQMGAGMWTWLPAGWRVHQRVVQIVREEMDVIGAQEMLMPVLQPAELWRKTGRLEIEELFKLADRKGSELVLALTHEEAVTFHIAQVVRSYRDLPLIVYHFQVKERDEARPRAGVLRTREFVMKDSYSFDRDRAGMDERYALHVEAYDRIMQRTGLRFYRVQGDVGMMGGLGAHEYMAPCPAGEDEVVLGDGYAANVEVALQSPGVEKVGEGFYVRDGERLTVEPAIEIGNIFKLGTRYSEPLGARYLDETGAEQPCGWPPTGSARRGSWPPPSSSSQTSTASPGRKRSRRSPCIWSGSARGGRRSATPPSSCMRRCATAAWRCSTTTAISVPARSSPTPSCSAARCG